MAKDPAFLFYSSDFLTGTIMMSHEQTGIYIKLLCVMHQHGGSVDKDAFDAFIGPHDIIRKKFIFTDDGFVFNERLISEMTKRSKKSSSLSANAKKSWENRCKSDANAMQLHMPTENANENEDIKHNNTTKEEKIKFLDFVMMTQGQYDKLAKKLGKEGVESYIDKLNNGIGSKGYKYKSHYHTILSWASKDVGTNTLTNPPKPLVVKKFKQDCHSCNGTGKMGGGSECWCWR